MLADLRQRFFVAAVALGRGIVTPMTQDRDILAEAAVALPHNTKQRES